MSQIVCKEEMLYPASILLSPNPEGMPPQIAKVANVLEELDKVSIPYSSILRESEFNNKTEYKAMSRIKKLF